jgi:hypothetical protein
MYTFITEELTWATVQEHELEARRAARHPTRRRAGRSFRSLVARTLVQTGLRLDGSAVEVVKKPAASRVRC